MAWAVGDRSEATCRRLWARVPEGYRRGLLYTDLWEAYRAVLPAGRHRPAGKGGGPTSHVERWNNTLRQRLGRFVRRTLSFRKSDEMHEVCLRLFIHDYNVHRLTT